MQALAKLQQIGNQGGLTSVDRAQLNQIQNQVSNQSAANRAATLQSMAQRGMAGSGAELATELAGNAAQTQSAADQGFNVAAQAQQRALQAIQQAGSMGGQIENTQFGEAAQKAQAQDAINRFNAQNAQNVAGQNVQRANYAQERNLNAQQQIGSANTNLENQQQVYNKGLQQQNFENQMQKQQGISNALNQQASTLAKSGDSTADLYSGLGQAAAKVGTAVGSSFGVAPTTKKPADDSQTT